ncbi:MAG: cation-translocating P-type ATPase [Lentisphaeria bacterium]|nr:cation-translocating P-type ATPase [Lentisphaeria bacterium]
MAENAWHELDGQTVLGRLKSSVEKGLSPEEAVRRLETYGPNELVRKDGRGVWRLLITQFTGPLVLLLVAAGIASIVLGDVKDAGVIFAIVILNGLLGFRQEYSAEKAMAALRKMAVPKVRVRRGGSEMEIPARELVPGDILLVEAGNVVPVDARILVAANLRAQEAALTGEAAPVGKDTAPISDPETSLGDRSNCLFMGTSVTYGRGEAVVVETGMTTQLGKVASLLAETADEATPLTCKIRHLAHILVGVAIFLVSLVAVQGLIRHDDWRTVFLTAVSMAVAAVPEGLPAVVTIALALGARRMLRRNALIRNLPAVETLGSVTTICTDKTGTLTQNRMTVVRLESGDGRVSMPENPEESVEIPAAARQHQLVLAAAALCNDAVLTASPTDPFATLGDPTEGALVVAAARAGLPKDGLSADCPRLAEAPFDSDRKRMSTVHRLPEDTSSVIAACLAPVVQSDTGAVLFAKGASGSILDTCARRLDGGTVKPFTDTDRQVEMGKGDALAGDGIRVLAVACKPLQAVPADVAAEENEFIYLGLVGMIDPLRPEVRDAAQTCLKAGIRVVMITGDHPLMASYIGRQLGLPNAEHPVTGRDVAAMSEDGLREGVKDTSVFARVSPEDKLRIVDALQANGHIVSMTGDGVNDAPALKSADIGVAMGITGTDVAKGAADMVLLDDRFTTIEAAVEEGRVIFDNIRRFVQFILACNAGELGVMLAAPFLGMPLPLLPVQILWMNLVTDGLPALALGIEPPERDVMSRPPRHPDAPVIDKKMGANILWMGAVMMIFSLAVGYYFWGKAGSPVGGAAHGEATQAVVWQTMLFTTMVFIQLFLAFALRSTTDFVWRKGLFSNPPLIWALAVTGILQAAVVYVPILQDFFRTTALSGRQFGLCLLTGFSVYLLVELSKGVKRFTFPSTPVPEH